MSKWINNVARMIKKKNGGYFLVFERRKDKDGNYVGESPFPLTIQEGDIFQAKKKADDLKGLVEMGSLTQEAADEICKRVGFEFSIAPKDEQPSEKTEEPKKEATKKPAKKSEVDF